MRNRVKAKNLSIEFESNLDMGCVIWDMRKFNRTSHIPDHISGLLRREHGFKSEALTVTPSP